MRCCGRESEGGGLLNRYTVEKPYRGFESLRHRQISDNVIVRPECPLCAQQRSFEKWIFCGAKAAVLASPSANSLGSDWISSRLMGVCAFQFPLLPPSAAYASMPQNS